MKHPHFRSILAALVALLTSCGAGESETIEALESQGAKLRELAIRVQDIEESSAESQDIALLEYRVKELEALRAELHTLAQTVSELSQGSQLQQGLAEQGGFLSAKPASFSVKEFIEWHRAYQDTEPQSKSLELRYARLYDQNPQGYWAYLALRAQYNPKDQLNEAKRALEAHPDEPYLLNMACFLAYNEEDPPQLAEALDFARRAAEIDPDLPASSAIEWLEEWVEVSRKAQELEFTFDTKEINRFLVDRKFIVERISRNQFKLTMRQLVDDGPLLPDKWIDAATYEVAFEYSGVARLSPSRTNAVDDSGFVPGIGFNCTVTPPDIGLDLICIASGPSTPEYTNIYLLRDEVRSAQGTVRFYTTLYDLAMTQKISIEEVTAP